jgi:hypothetical protein
VKQQKSLYGLLNQKKEKTVIIGANLSENEE